MNTKGIVAIFATGSLALGLVVGGVSTAYAMDLNHSHDKSHHSATPAVPATPNPTPTPSHRVQVIVAPVDVFNLIKAQYDNTLYPSARYEAAPGSYAATIERAGGQSAQYISRDGNTITIGVGKGDFRVAQAAIANNSILLKGYSPNVKVYEVKGGGTFTGDYEVFVDGYWFSLTSNLFTSPQAAAPIIQAALQSVPQG